VDQFLYLLPATLAFRKPEPETGFAIFPVIPESGFSSEIPAEIPEKSIISSRHRRGDPIPIGRTKSCLFRIFRLN